MMPLGNQEPEIVGVEIDRKKDHTKKCQNVQTAHLTAPMKRAGLQIVAVCLDSDSHATLFRRTAD